MYAKCWPRRRASRKNYQCSNWLAFIIYLLERCTKKKIAHIFTGREKASLIWKHISCERVCRATIEYHSLHNNVEYFTAKTWLYFKVYAHTHTHTSCIANKVKPNEISFKFEGSEKKPPIRSSWSSFKWNEHRSTFSDSNDAKTWNSSTETKMSECFSFEYLASHDLWVD